MAIEIHWPTHKFDYAECRIFLMIPVMFFVLCVPLELTGHLRVCRESLCPPLPEKITLWCSITRQDHCNVSYDECRCSAMSNETHQSPFCINDTQFTRGYIFTLISYAVQIYSISKLFFFTGKYSEILTDLFWVIALTLFVLIMLFIQGNPARQSYVVHILFLCASFLYFFSLYLFAKTRPAHIATKHRTTIRYLPLKAQNEKQRMVNVIVSL